MGASLSFVLMAVMLVATLVYFRTGGQEPMSSSVRARGVPPRLFLAGDGPLVAGLHCSSSPPSCVLIVFSFSADRNVGRWGGFTLEWYQGFVEPHPAPERGVGVGPGGPALHGHLGGARARWPHWPWSASEFRGRQGVRRPALSPHHHPRRDHGGDDAVVLL